MKLYGLDQVGCVWHCAVRSCNRRSVVILCFLRFEQAHSLPIGITEAVILVQRLYVMYNCNRPLRAVLLALLFAQLISQAVVMGLSVGHIQVYTLPQMHIRSN